MISKEDQNNFPVKVIRINLMDIIYPFENDIKKIDSR